MKPGKSESIILFLPQQLSCFNIEGILHAGSLTSHQFTTMLCLGQTLKSKVGSRSSFTVAATSVTAIGTICFVRWQSNEENYDNELTSKSKVLATSAASALPARNAILPSRDEQISKLLASSERKHEFDVLVIGGGATGAGAALDATTRGLSTVLIEKGDFGNETSSRST